jgi:hypothetical protein
MSVSQDGSYLICRLARPSRLSPPFSGHELLTSKRLTVSRREFVFTDLRRGCVRYVGECGPWQGLSYYSTRNPLIWDMRIRVNVRNARIRFMCDESDANELLTLDDVAALLKVTRAQVLELTRKRTQERAEHPLPVVKFHAKLLRVRKKEFYDWVERVATAQRKGVVEVHAITTPKGLTKTKPHRFAPMDLDLEVLDMILSTASVAGRKIRTGASGDHASGRRIPRSRTVKRRR